MYLSNVLEDRFFYLSYVYDLRIKRTFPQISQHETFSFNLFTDFFFHQSPLNFIIVSPNFYIFTCCISLVQEIFLSSLRSRKQSLVHSCENSRSFTLHFELNPNNILYLRCKSVYTMSNIVHFHDTHTQFHKCYLFFKSLSSVLSLCQSSLRY